MTLGRRVPEGLNFGVALNVNNIASEAIPLIRRIRPQWNLSEIKHKQFTTGITNKLYGFYTNSDPKDTLLFRVYGEKTDLFIDREREKRNMMILCEAGEAPLYYGSFMNGLIYEFVPGQTLTTVSVRDPDIFPAVCASLARFHKIQTPEPSPKDSEIWPLIENIFSLLPTEGVSDQSKRQRFETWFCSVDAFHAEVQNVRSILSSLSSKLVFCHNDLLLENLIHDAENGKITFIDYEYGFWNYQPFDIANHFNEFAGVDTVDYSLFPSPVFQKDWIRIYLQEYNGTSDVADQEVNELFRLVGKFTLLSHLFWAVWAVLQSNFSRIDFDFLGYATIRYKRYLDTKDHYLAL